jgi:acyl-CoA reductase-like NAD-dependent aldehyde dehydrogenase
VLIGGQRRGALYPTHGHRQRPARLPHGRRESFGPLAPISPCATSTTPSTLANSTAYGLSSGVVTTSLPPPSRPSSTLRCGTVNINDVPGFRIESSPFGGIKDSGLGIKEGVIEAIKAYSFVKTFSLPW